jgi:ribA/ribD-fused uncharacterized protein
MNTLFFFGIEGDNGYLSNWYPAKFELTCEGKTYQFQNVEQAMMASKAKVFGDLEIFNEILTTSDPKSVKKLGRKVKNFDEKIWDKYKKQIVKTSVQSKFTYNPLLLKKLLSTQNDYIAEDSPYDKIWGIGTRSKIQKENRSWPGKNLLGVILMELREEFKNNAI